MTDNKPGNLFPENIFRAYDIRGLYPEGINEKNAALIILNFITSRYKNQKIKILVARDTRLSSPAIYKEILESLKNSGLKLEITAAGLSTTPMFYFLVNAINSDYGIMITASHNPKEYNGLKICGKKGTPISGKEIYAVIQAETIKKIEARKGK